MAFPTASLYGRYEAQFETYNNDDPVDSATDQSSQGNAPAAAGAARPTFKTGILNGLPVYRFDGSNDRLVDSILTSDLVNVSALSIGAVLSSGADEATSRVWPWALNGGSTNNIFAFTEGVTSGEWGTFLRDDGGTIQQTTSGVDTTAFCVLTAIWNGTTAIFYRNGTQINSGSLTSIMDVREINIGGYLNQFFSGDITLTAVWSKALSDTERADFHCYVQDTYGITVADTCPGADERVPRGQRKARQPNPIRYPARYGM